MKKIYKIILIALMSTMLFACGKNIEVSLKDTNVSLLVGDNFTLVTELSKRDDKITFNWESSDQLVATVDQFGVVHARASGQAIVTVTIVGNGNSASSTIDVSNVNVSKINLNKEINNLFIGEQISLTATISPINATNKNISWSSSNPLIASVSDVGLLRAIIPGTTTISVISEDGNLSDEFEFTVKNVELEGLLILGLPKSIFIGDSVQFEVMVVPENYFGTIVWSIEGLDIASIDQNGLLTTFGVGTINVIASYEGSEFSSSKSVIISPIKVLSIEVEEITLYLSVGEQHLLVVNVLPSNATFSELSFTSDNHETISVDQNGLIRSLKEGQATIKIINGPSGVNIDILVISTNLEAQSIEIIEDEIDLYMESTYALNTVILPSNTTNKTVSWNSSNVSIASVDEDGVVRPISVGQATITATINGVWDSVIVNVLHIPVEGIQLNYENLRMGINSIDKLIPLIYPHNAGIKNVTFFSDDPSVVSVDELGFIRSLTIGFATITVTTVDGGFSAQCEIEVFVSEVLGISVNENTASIYEGEELILTVNIFPSYANNKDVTWESSDSQVATIVDGVIIGLKKGTTIIKITTVDGNYNAYYNLQVKEVKQSGIIEPESDRILYLGEKIKLKVTFSQSTPEDEIVWSSTNSSIALVDQTGLVSTKNVGKVEIKVSLNDEFVVYYELEIKHHDENQIIPILYERLLKNSVSIIAFDNAYHETSNGSGFVFKEDATYAYIYTNAHVVSKSAKFEVVYYNKIRQVATKYLIDDNEDVAILRVVKSNNYEVAVLGDSDDVLVGEKVFTIGSPLNLKFAGSITSGIISGKNIILSLDNDGNGTSNQMILFQIDAAINPGNSGGPLYNLRGELIGINTLKLIGGSGGEDIESFNYALPINFFDFVGQKLITNGYYNRPLVDIDFREVYMMSLSTRSVLGISANVHHGLYIDAFRNPYDDNTIQKQTIVVSINGVSIKSASEYIIEILKYSSEDIITVTTIDPNGLNQTDHLVSLYG